jgi:hypothetical protein
MKRSGWHQDVYPGVGKLELARIAIIGNDVDIELAMCLFEQGVYDRGDEFGLFVGGYYDTELDLIGGGSFVGVLVAGPEKSCR